MATTSNGSRTNVHEIASGIYRISTPVDLAGVPGGFTFNQYLVVDDEPLLFHTGPRRLFPEVRDAVATVMPVTRLRWIGFSHVEADECGSLNQWLAAAPQATPLCGQVAAMVSIADLADRAPRALADGESLSLGTRRVTLDRHAAPAPRLGVRLPPRDAHAHPALRRSVHPGRERSSRPDRGRHFRPQRGLPAAHGLLLPHPERATASRASRGPRAHHAGLHARQRVAGRWGCPAEGAGRGHRALTPAAAASPGWAGGAGGRAAVLPLPDFRARLWHRDGAQVTYNSTVTHDGVVERGRRSSIPSRTPNGRVFRLHQGTPYEA